MNYHVKIAELNDREKKLCREAWKNTFPDEKEEKPEPLPNLNDIINSTKSQQIKVFCRLIREMPKGFWGENGSVICDRQMWRYANKLAESISPEKSHDTEKNPRILD